MFTDLLDTTRFAKPTADTSKKYAMGILYLALLNGVTPVLSLPQVFDSSFILELGKDQGFLDTLRNGYIRVSLYKAENIKDYMQNVLTENLKKNEIEFRFSSMPFLDNYPDTTLRKIYKELLIASQKDTSIRSIVLLKEEAEKVDEFLRSINNIHSAIIEGNSGKGHYILSVPAKFQLKDTVRACINAYYNRACSNIGLSNDSVQQGFHSLCKRLLKLYDKDKDNNFRYRSVNYKAVEKIKGYDKGSVDAVKALIDYAYNTVTASSIPDFGEKDILGISKEFPFLIATADAFPKTVTSVDPQLISFNSVNTSLTWEIVKDIVTEIKNIQQIPKYSSWREALHKYDSKLQRQPYLKSAIYGFISTAFFVGANILVDTFADPMDRQMIGFTLACAIDAVNEIIKKPSITAIVESGCNNKIKRQTIRQFTVDTAFFIDPK